MIKREWVLPLRVSVGAPNKTPQQTLRVTHSLFIFFLSLILLNANWAWASENRVPSVQEVAEQALGYARLGPSTIRQWERKVRKAPLVPRIQAGFERSLKNNVNLNVEDSVAVNSSGITIGPAQQKQVQNADSDFNFEVKAVWYLDQLLFSKDDLEISQEARELARERERLLSQVRQFYFKRERGLKELALLKKSRVLPTDIELKKLEIAEATAALDNLTGGWFSSAMVGAP
ncbi:MAG: hypothetical protein A2W61_02465 [Deltaproteobacteria bacterium RIFCSPLOWO2_01_44_7]|nr:MAG: hypothetical protein A2712_00735 [Deltaproteobacteria bacterium RIFCSPHIGHO2_01_FULL_43_49]OGQ14200.1 MAG: hypothetical protein A3D22_09875 [Deltaproteobacteria bacterium RIFCSPHIGHO2_02_FULL_44_53]OGQ27416.1 MAG: hypothetical protein A3D98_03475 [Deltaproteobacteria bacterium RIFCSPHIGHO2_12_FULL_44_21]OGQ30664.1 MAG: hypothetical protein A2979_05900 [Deltaproteobacteria bacterium RIFCSPLOWO2_01_FULL_45_74]OGQ39456.1 MAG: hypothetical protein A2W61_02465 [Deltaproteobacteria bacterium 